MKKLYLILFLVTLSLNADEPLKAKCSRDDSKDVVICEDIVHGKLMWQDDKETKRLKLKRAKEYCRNLTLADHSDWRMPTITELLSIVDYTRTEYMSSICRGPYGILLNECLQRFKIVIDFSKDFVTVNKAFKNMKRSYHLSATPSSYSSNSLKSTRRVYFYDAVTDRSGGAEGAVRCVRDAE